MSLLVMKFGGTSVGNATAIAALAEITREQLAVWDRVVVVVSAMSGVTDLLIQGAQTAATGDADELQGDRARGCARSTPPRWPSWWPRPRMPAATRAPIEQLIDEFELLCHSVHVLGEVSPRALDAISGLGERMSARLVAAALRARGIPAEAVDATEFVITTAHFGGAVPLQPQTRERAQARLDAAAGARRRAGGHRLHRRHRERRDAPRSAAAAATTAARSSARRSTPTRWRSTPTWTA